MAAALEGQPDVAVRAKIQRRKNGAPDLPNTIKQAGDDTPGRRLLATAHALAPGRTGFMSKIDRVLLVHRLLEVTARIGFTRFEPDVDAEPALDVRRAAPSREAGGAGGGDAREGEEAHGDAWVSS